MSSSQAKPERGPFYAQAILSRYVEQSTERDLLDNVASPFIFNQSRKSVQLMAHQLQISLTESAELMRTERAHKYHSKQQATKGESQLLGCYLNKAPFIQVSE